MCSILRRDPPLSLYTDYVRLEKIKHAKGGMLGWKSASFFRLRGTAISYPQQVLNILNRDVTIAAEQYGFDFALAMIKLRGYGGVTRHWDECLEAFTLTSALAAVTKRIRFFRPLRF